MPKCLLIFNILWSIFFSVTLLAKDTVTVGSKAFTEGYILSEVIAQILEEVGEVNVVRKLGLGGTGVIYQALLSNEIQIYPEYSGTISEAILKETKLNTISEINKALSLKNLSISESFGFNNTYGLAVRKEYASKFNLNTISDLKKIENIRAVFSHEFVNRKDGLRFMENHYNLKFNNFKSIEHALAYEAIKNKKADVIEIYTTDAKIKKFDLKVLEDNKSFFPKYYPVLFTQAGFPKKYPRSWHQLQNKLINKISAEKILELNSLVELNGHSIKAVASNFLTGSTFFKKDSMWKKVSPKLFEHIQLVLAPLFVAIIFGIILGILSVQYRKLGQIIILQSGLLQTIPSLALLCFLIPLVGIGKPPAYIALFLYSLLPIVRGVYTGLTTINPKIKDYSKILGLSFAQKLWFVDLPLASRSIMAGIKTSAVISVGTATLAAFIGAGGLGELIVRGLTLNDQNLILLGAIPAAVLAIFIHYFFELLDYIIIPKGLN